MIRTLFQLIHISGDLLKLFCRLLLHQIVKPVLFFCLFSLFFFLIFQFQKLVSIPQFFAKLIETFISSSMLTDIFDPESIPSIDRDTVQTDPFFFISRILQCFFHLFFTQLDSVTGCITDVQIPVTDLCIDSSGSLKQFSVSVIYQNQTTLDAAFKKSGDQKATGRRHISCNDLQMWDTENIGNAPDKKQS